MHATAAGAAAHAARFPGYRDAGFHRAVFDVEVSSLGIGTYLGVAGVPPLDRRQYMRLCQ
jgi:hypothetical protein